MTSKFYRLWKNLYQERIEAYDSKTRAVQIIWKRIVEDARKEKHRAYQMWKERFTRFRVTKFKVKQLLWKKLYKQMMIAMAAWKNFNTYFET